MKSIEETLQQIPGVMKAAGIGTENWALSSSSLLGQIRCGGVIPYDDDGDIEVRESQLPKIQNLLDSNKNLFENRFLLTTKNEQVTPYVLIDVGKIMRFLFWIILLSHNFMYWILRY